MDTVATKNIKVIRPADAKGPLQGMRATHMWVDELTDYYQDCKSAMERQVITKGGYSVEIQSGRLVADAQDWVTERNIDGWLRMGVFFWFPKEQDALEFTLRWR